TWLQLADGTPLVTAARKGQGMIALVHTTAGPLWSDFCYSGFYVEMLRRFATLGTAAAAGMDERADLSPHLLMDAMGRLSPPDVRAPVAALSSADAFAASPRTPPGLYGRGAGMVARNLSEALPRMTALQDMPA